MRSLLVAVLVFLAAAGDVPAAPDANGHRSFFENLKKLCGQRFEGKTDFPQNADHPLVGKRLVMSVETCSESEVRIPFRVDEDKSRTWILTLTDKGLLLKHDHRHLDGTPDKVTMYGGWAGADGTGEWHRFPADDATAKLIPEAAGNVWILRIDLEQKRFSYELERDKQPRYKATFDLRKSV